MRFKTIATVLLGAVLVLSGCAAQDEPSSEGAGASAASEVADLGFTGTTLAGEEFDGQTLAGTPTVFWFWAPWCPTCRAQSAGVSALAQEYEGQVNVVGVGGLAGAEDIRDYAETVTGPTYLVDPEGAIWKHFGVTAQSTYLVVDADGQVTAKGYLDDPDLADRVATLAG